MSLDLDRSTTEDPSMSPHCVEIHRGDFVCHSAASTATMTRSKNGKKHSLWISAARDGSMIAFPERYLSATRRSRTRMPMYKTRAAMPGHSLPTG